MIINAIKVLICSTQDDCGMYLFQEVVEGLQDLGHEMKSFNVGGSVICAIARQNGKIYANSDFRKAGEVDGF